MDDSSLQAENCHSLRPPRRKNRPFFFCTHTHKIGGYFHWSGSEGSKNASGYHITPVPDLQDEVVQPSSSYTCYKKKRLCLFINQGISTQEDREKQTALEIACTCKERIAAWLLFLNSELASLFSFHCSKKEYLVSLLLLMDV